MKKFIIGADIIANFSGDSFARLFGDISPNISTRTVIITVDTVAPISPPKIRTKSIVLIEESAIFTILFPISIVERRRSKFSDMDKTLSAFLLPFSDKCFSRVLLNDEKAVSVAEKYADIIMSTAIIIIVVMSPVSMR